MERPQERRYPWNATNTYSLRHTPYLPQPKLIFTDREVEKETIVESDSSGWFVTAIRNRLNTGRNFACCLVGDTGSGKSALAIKIAEVLDPTFNVDRILFDPSPFFDLVTELPNRSFVVLDESGVVLDAQRWMTLFAKMFGYVLETYRFKQINLIFVLPDFAMLNVNARRVTHALVKVFDRGLGYVYKLRKSYVGVIWTKKMGVLRNVQLPSKALWEAYEEKKHQAFDKLARNIRSELALKNKLFSLYSGTYLGQSEQPQNEQIESILNSGQALLSTGNLPIDEANDDVQETEILKKYNLKSDQIDTGDEFEA